MQQKTTCEEAAVQTVRQYSSMVYRLAYSLVKTRADADDIHQEVFVRYLTKAPAFASTEHERAWFIRVTVNLCKDWWKNAWKRRVISLTELVEYDHGLMEARTESMEVIELVKALPYKYRVVIHLFYYEELSVAEIAETLKLKESAVRTRLTRARRRLSELLKEDV